MDNQQLRNLVMDAVSDADLSPDEIPAIDLYVDQITSLAAEKLREGSPRFHDRVLTKTMINNYSKDGLISPVKGKKYSKEQFLQILLVYSLKNTLSIGEIKRILQNLYELPEYNETMLKDTYTRFLEIKTIERESSYSLIEQFLSHTNLDLSKESDYMTMILGLASISSYFKNLTQALLEAHYPEICEEDDEDEDDEEKQREKAVKKAAKKAVKAAKKAKKASEGTA